VEAGWSGRGVHTMSTDHSRDGQHRSRIENCLTQDGQDRKDL
jgi:hypothetical protein